MDEDSEMNAAQLSLFREADETLPSWWTAHDTDCCTLEAYYHAIEWGEAPPDDHPDLEAFYEQEEADGVFAAMGAFIDEALPSWNCRRCRFFRSEDGVSGACDGPELTSPYVEHWQMCEQWMPRVKDVRFEQPAAAEQ